MLFGLFNRKLNRFNNLLGEVLLQSLFFGKIRVKVIERVEEVL